MQGGRSEEGNGMGNGKSGDPWIAHTFKNDVEHVLETDELDELWIGWLVGGDQNSLDGMGHGRDGQFK